LCFRPIAKCWREKFSRWIFGISLG